MGLPAKTVKKYFPSPGTGLRAAVVLPRLGWLVFD
jgi:hypothetical protein